MVPASLTSRIAPHVARVEAVVIGGSAGSVRALELLLPQLPAEFPPVLIVVHVLASSSTSLAAIYSRRAAARVLEAASGTPIERGHVYFAPADYHLLVEPSRRCSLSIEPPVHFSRPAIDVLFESAAQAYGPALVGVVLTGASADGARGLRALVDRGGRALVQEPVTAEVPTMPEAALRLVPEAKVVPLSSMVAELCALERAS
jgi:two-component system, chemotaxis family, protein-glutamate methylesterase/glutaminase